MLECFWSRMAITIPIPKDDKNGVFDHLEDFQCITIRLPVFYRMLLNSPVLNV